MYSTAMYNSFPKISCGNNCKSYTTCAARLYAVCCCCIQLSHVRTPTTVHASVAAELSHRTWKVCRARPNCKVETSDFHIFFHTLFSTSLHKYIRPSKSFALYHSPVLLPLGCFAESATLSQPVHAPGWYPCRGVTALHECAMGHVQNGAMRHAHYCTTVSEVSCVPFKSCSGACKHVPRVRKEAGGGGGWGGIGRTPIFPTSWWTVGHVLSMDNEF